MAGFQDLTGSFAPAGNIGKPLLTAFEARLTSNAPTAPGLESSTPEQSGQVNVMNPWIGSGPNQSVSPTQSVAIAAITRSRRQTYLETKELQ